MNGTRTNTSICAETVPLLRKQLNALRTKHGAQSAVGSRCSNLIRRAIPFWDASEWSYDKKVDDRAGRILLPEYEDRKFFAQDGSDYRAVVLTAPDFYCAEHSPIQDSSAAPPQS